MTCWWDTGPNTDRKRRRKSRVDLKLFKVFFSLWKVWTNIVFHAQWGHAEHQPCIILFVILSCPSSCFPTQIDCYVCLIVDLEPFRPTKPWPTHITCPPELPTCLINKDTDSFRQNSQDLIFNFNDWQVEERVCYEISDFHWVVCLYEIVQCAFALVAGQKDLCFMLRQRDICTTLSKPPSWRQSSLRQRPSLSLVQFTHHVVQHVSTRDQIKDQ